MYRCKRACIPVNSDSGTDLFKSRPRFGKLSESDVLVPFFTAGSPLHKLWGTTNMRWGGGGDPCVWRGSGYTGHTDNRLGWTSTYKVVDV
jgi:hypothetical protein